MARLWGNEIPGAASATFNWKNDFKKKMHCPLKLKIRHSRISKGVPTRASAHMLPETGARIFPSGMFTIDPRHNPVCIHGRMDTNSQLRGRHAMEHRRMIKMST